MEAYLSKAEINTIWCSTKGIEELALSIQKALINKIKNEGATAYITYKGNLLHADDPKVEEYSDPTPLYDLPESEPCTVH